MISSGNALLIIVKYPQAAKVKTRMYPQLSYEESAELYRAIVEDLLYSLRPAQGNSDYDIIICFAPSAPGAAFEEWLNDPALYHAQKGKDLGEKLHNAFSDTFDAGYEKVVVIGSDCLDLTVNDINGAFAKLALNETGSTQNRAVIGPTEDGGYYLIGASHLSRRSIPELFQDVQWSTKEVFSETIGKLKSLKVKYTELKMKYDIDSFEDAQRFWKDLQSGKDIHAPRTRKILEKIENVNNSWIA